MKKLVDDWVFLAKKDIKNALLIIEEEDLTSIVALLEGRCRRCSCRVIGRRVITEDTMLLLHGFVKKSRKILVTDLKTANDSAWVF
jgi:hypothetical protein